MWGGFPDSLSLGGKRSGTKLAGRRCLRLLQASAGVFHGPGTHPAWTKAVRLNESRGVKFQRGGNVINCRGVKDVPLSGSYFVGATLGTYCCIVGILLD